VDVAELSIGDVMVSKYIQQDDTEGVDVSFEPIAMLFLFVFRELLRCCKSERSDICCHLP